MRLSDGGISYADIMEMPLESFVEWLEDAIQVQKKIPRT